MKFPIAIQLYSVRDDMEKDFYGTLEKVKALGYEGVEFAGLFNEAPEKIKAKLEELANSIANISGGLDELQKQVDGEVSSYFLVGAPVTVEKNNSNVEYDAVNTEVEPLSTWLLNYDKNDDIYTLKVDGKDELFNNLGDTYTNTETYKEDGSKPLAGKSWRWCDATSAINKGEITGVDFIGGIQGTLFENKNEIIEVIVAEKMKDLGLLSQ